jgi:CHASE2 domain-containing sensor protein
MSKSTESSRRRAKSTARDWPVVIYIWAFGTGITGYVIARILLDGQPHPWHWASGIAGGLIGVSLGWLWYRWKGDVI